MNFKNIMLLLFLAGSGCDKEEAVDPVVVTHEAQQIGATSVVLEAVIQEAGSVRPIQYGFLWGTAGGLNILNAANKLELGSAGGPKTFSIKLDNLTANTVYYVKGYAASPDYAKIYYGNEISFKTLP